MVFYKNYYNHTYLRLTYNVPLKLTELDMETSNIYRNIYKLQLPFIFLKYQ